MRFRRRRSEEPEINLIPFIDVLLVILIFLMLSTTYSKYSELQITLPTADAERIRERPAEVIVSARATRRIPARDFRLKLGHLFPSETLFSGEGVEHHPAMIVAGGFVFAARIAEAGNERDGHDSKNIRRNLVVVTQ